MKIKFKLVIILLFALMMSFSGCDFFGDDGDGGGGGSDPVYYAIGDTGPSGVGIVFYITDGGLHGLEAAPGDLSPSPKWIEGGSTQTDSNYNTAMAIGTGLANSNAIIAQAGHTGSAAQACRSYKGGGLNDWFLPSKDELYQLYLQMDIVGGFLNDSDYYWSSSEYGSDYAWAWDFTDGIHESGSKALDLSVRAVRAY